MTTAIPAHLMANGRKVAVEVAATQQTKLFCDLLHVNKQLI